MATFGKTDIGGTTKDLTAATYFGVRFIAPEDGTVVSMSFYCQNKKTATLYRIALYTAIDCAHTTLGRPGTLLGESGQQSLADGWNTASVSASITAGATYFMMIKANDTITIAYNADADTYKTFLNTGQTWDGFGTIPGLGHTHEARAYSIYATYTPAAPPAVGGETQPYFVFAKGGI